METIRKCPTCGIEREVNVGVHNWRNLFKKPTTDDWIILIMLILIMFTTYSYKHDTDICRETMKNIDVICSQRVIGDLNITRDDWNINPVIYNNES
jgi:hypothetical protein